MAIVKDPSTGKYKIIPSPPSFYEPKKPKKKTVPPGFVGPLQPGVTREEPEPVFAGPVRPGTDVEEFRRTGKSVPKAPVFAGPVRPGTDPEVFKKTGVSVPIEATKAQKDKIVKKAEELRKQQEIIAKKKKEDKIVLPEDIKKQLKIEEQLKKLDRKETIIIPPTPYVPEPTPRPDVQFFGDKEFRFVEQPSFGTTMDTDVGGKRRELVIGDISPDYTAGIIRKVEEYIPGAGVAITSLDEEIYLPDSKSTEKYKDIMSSWKPGAGKDMRKFLRDQQAQYKKDLGRYNALTARGGEGYKYLSTKEFKELQDLQNKLNLGIRGTGWQLIADAGRAAEQRGETVKILGADVSPQVARGLLAGSVDAYKTARDVALFQAGAGAIGIVVGSTAAGAKVLEVVAKATKPLKYAIAPTGLGLGTARGFQMYAKTGDLPIAIGAGVGTILGFFGGVYSKEIFDASGKLMRGINIRLTKPLSRPPISATKRAEMDIFRRKGGSKYAKQQLLKYETQKGIDVKAILREQAFDDLIKYGSPDEVQAYLKNALNKLSKMDISLAEKQQMARNLMGRIAKAKGGVVITDASGNVIGVHGQQIKPPAIEQLATDSLMSPTAVGETAWQSGGVFGSSVSRVRAAEGLLTGVDIKKDTKSKQELQTEQERNLLFSLNADMTQEQYAEQSLQQEAALLTGMTQVAQQDQSPLFDMRMDQKMAQQSLTGQVTSPVQDFGMPGIGGFGMRGNGRPPRRPTPKPKKPKPLKPIPLKFDFEKAKTVKKQGWNVLVKRKATGVKPYWERMNPKGKAFDEKTALSVGARTTDEEIPARFKIEKARKYVATGIEKVGKMIPKAKGKTKVKVYSMDDKYFQGNKKKFRQFTQKKGAKTFKKNEYIELSRHRIDSPGEKRALKLAKKRTPTKPKKTTRKKRTPFGF